MYAVCWRSGMQPIVSCCLWFAGAATSIYAACSPELEAHSGAYLSDCKVCKPPAEWHDQELVDALWKRTEAEVHAAKPLDS